MAKLGRPVVVIELSKEEQEQRAKVVLPSTEGRTGQEIALRVGLS